MFQSGNYWWPDGEEVDGGIPGNDQWVAQQTLNAKIYAGLVPPQFRRVAVQAGGNVGIFPCVLAKEGFQHVLTFEPDPANFECLILNTLGFPGLIAFQMGLADKSRRYQVVHNTTNSGASYLTTGIGRGSTVTMPLDAMRLENCDLLQLDIEGMELFALQGAEDTIRRCKPVIVWEFNACAARYGVVEEDLTRWMQERGYVLHEKRGRDQTWLPK